MFVFALDYDQHAFVEPGIHQSCHPGTVETLLPDVT